MNKQQILEFYSRFIWPILRIFLKQSKRCSRCIISEKYSSIKNNLCEYCQNYSSSNTGKDNQYADLHDEFAQKIHNYMDAKVPYDTLLMLSGGKDSAYILERMRREFPALRILCLFVENGFSSPFAAKNAENLCKKLEVDLIINNSEISDFKEIFKNAFLNLNGKPSYGVVDYADGTRIFEIGKKLAQDLNIPFVIGGLSWVQVEMIVGINTFIQSEADSPDVLFPLAVWKVDEREIKQSVVDKKLLLPGTSSPVVSNNDLILTMSAIDILNLGYCSFEPELAQLIREGKSSRSEWLYLFELLEFATLKGYIKKDIESTLDRLNIKLSDVISK